MNAYDVLLAKRIEKEINNLINVVLERKPIEKNLMCFSKMLKF